MPQHLRPITLTLLLLLASGTTTAQPLEWLAPLGTPLEQEQAILDLLQPQMATRRLVLLGEASHGTHEFYHWRDQISRRLIAEEGFHFIAVEGDWKPLFRVNRWVKGLPQAPASAHQALAGLTRWPTWMWANRETEALITWLQQWNAEQPAAQRVGFYGIDLYAPWDSADALLDFAERYLSEEQGEPIAAALEPLLNFREEISGYIQATLPHQQQQRDRLEQLRAQLEALDDPEIPRHEQLSARLNALVIRNAHDHYLAMANPAENSWNPRAEHMHQVITLLQEYYGEGSRGLVWAHNTHIGDARATPMVNRGEVNIGQLTRQQHGDDAIFALGFATHRGELFAARQWGGQRQRMTAPPALEGSLEAALNHHFPDGALLALTPPPTAELAEQVVHHRAIGVLYNPESERGNYVPSRLFQRYDALLFLPESGALTPLDQAVD